MTTLCQIRRFVDRIASASFAAWCAVAWVACLGLVAVAEGGDQPQRGCVVFSEEPGAFPLLVSHSAASISIDPDDHAVVAIAARDLAADIQAVGGAESVVHADGRQPGSASIIVGTVSRSRWIDVLVRSGRLDVSQLSGKWETFLITVVKQPWPGVDSVLVIAGSDRRGTAFGAYELSQQIGVSPWVWWADVPPARHEAIFVSAGSVLMGPPSVKYRGIFINDEDWGMQPWAAKTYAPEEGGIGPKVYRRVFELLLRLKANTLWPAMHACTPPFNAFPENARLADEYAIVMGSSHAEPMLRNNVSEWKAPKEAYNYVSNREGVLGYWEERMRANGAFENIYTLGMRGIHDSNMIGPASDAERIATLERIFEDQQALIGKYASSGRETPPQMFCAYKEVLDLYRQGLKVPADVTVVWPDDNFGYVRNFATAEERAARPGGFGVYYHLSYLGRPLAYLWLCTTPPALIWEEMYKAWQHGADRIWIVNVGDLKPAEVGTEFFLQMAWDIHRWRPDNIDTFLDTWAAREFGQKEAPEIASLMREYYQLNFQRKPEHLQWWLPQDEPRRSMLTADEMVQRMQRCFRLQERAWKLSAAVTDERADALGQLVLYPILGSTYANQRYFRGESGDAAASSKDFKLQVATQLYNEKISRGKWKGFMHQEPADDDWKSMRIAPWHAGMIPAGEAARSLLGGFVAVEAENFDGKADGWDTAWVVVPGLGRSGTGAVAALRRTDPDAVGTQPAAQTPYLEYHVSFARAGRRTLSAYMLPTHPLVAGGDRRVTVALDDQPPRTLSLTSRDGSPEWAAGVLDNASVVSIDLDVPRPGDHTLKLLMVDAGVVVDKIVIHDIGAPLGYLGPDEQRREH